MKSPKERILTAILLLAILFVMYSFAVSSETAPDLSAKAAALYEPTTKSFLYTKNADMKLPMASTTKIMTALVAIENFPLDQMVIVADEAVGTEGSSLYLKKRETLSMKDLVTALMLRSANDAAVAIAFAVSGSIDAFADLMNKRCEALGLVSTNFKNPHGLDHEEHYTTARELAIISAEAMRNEVFKSIASMKTAKIESTNENSRIIANHNKLLSLYEGANGIKTGFTKKCGRCLVGSCEKDGLSFITVTLDAPNDWNDHISLFNYGYSRLTYLKGAEAGQFVYNVPIINSSERQITVANENPFGIVTDKKENELQHHVKLIRYTIAPVKSGDVLGKIIFTLNGEYVGEVDLIAQNEAKAENKRKIFSFIK